MWIFSGPIPHLSYDRRYAFSARPQWQGCVIELLLVQFRKFWMVMMFVTKSITFSFPKSGDITNVTENLLRNLPMMVEQI